MIVHARGVRDGFEHAIERGTHLIGSHSHAQLDFLGGRAFGAAAFRLRFHRKMQQDLIAAAISLLGDLGGERQVRQNGNRERKWQREQRIGGGAVVAHVVENDGEPRVSVQPRSGGARADGERRDHVDRVRAISIAREIVANHAAGGGFSNRQLVAPRDFGERLPQRAGLRGVGERYIDVVCRQMALGAGPELLNFRTNGDFGFTSGDALGGADDFDGDGAKFRFREVFLLAADQEENGDEQEKDGGATRTTESRSLTPEGVRDDKVGGNGRGQGRA